MKTLKLFNSVIAQDSTEKPFVSQEGYIIEPSAIWAKDKIQVFLKEELKNGEELNKTFYKSWEKIMNSTRGELLWDQILHYISTYGSDFQEDVYIPSDVLDVPDTKLIFKVIKGYSKEELTQKALDILRSGAALAEDTLNDILTVLVSELGYEFTGDEGIRNKEAIVRIADLYNVIPKDVMEFFRYIIYRSTDSTLLIKNATTIKEIKESNYNPGIQFKKFGLEKLATIFNRFKPLFLAYKGKCPTIINKISRLSKTFHKPIIVNPLNTVTSVELIDDDTHWLDNATPFALFKALTVCHTRMEGQDAFVYRIRNGKSWTTEGKGDARACKANYERILNYLKNNYSLKGKKIFLPENINYALPTSEKMFVGNIPTGTKFFGERLAVGFYWENSWGASDLDLSAIDLAGRKIGWNASYGEGGGPLMYSGDMTDAKDGAVEYLYASRDLKDSNLVQCNVYRGDSDAKYNIIIGKGDTINKDYMMNPNNLLASIPSQAVEKQTVIGIFIPEEDQQTFIVLNFGSGQLRVSSRSGLITLSNTALVQKWKNTISFNNLVTLLGAEVVSDPDEAEFNFNINSLEKDSFIQLFNRT